MPNFLKSANFNGTNGNHFFIELYYDLVQDVNENKSTITYHLWIGSGDGYSGSGSSAVVGSINGSEVGRTYSIGRNDYFKLGDRSIEINHSADGKATASYSATVNSNWSYLGNASISGSITLPTIPRASSVTATDAYIESATSINIARASNSFKHKLTYSFEGLTGTIAENVDTNYGWKIPTSFYAKIPNKSSAICTVTCQTLSGSNVIGTKTTTFKVSVDTSKNKPTLSATIEDTNSACTSLTGSNQKLIKGYSNVKIAMTATANNSATIKSKQILCGDGKKLTDSGTLNKVENGKFTISATDSRDISNSLVKTLTMVNYIELSLNANFYRPSETGNNMSLTFNGNYFNASFGSVANTLSLKYRYKESTSNTWSSYVTITPTISGNKFTNGTSAKDLGAGFDYQKEYDFELVATDKLKSATFKQRVSVGKPVFDWGKDDFQFNVPVKLKNGNQLIEDVYPVGSIYLSVNGTNPTTYFGGTWEQIAKGRTLVGVDTSQTEFNTVKKTGGEKTHKLTISEMPEHTHDVPIHANGKTGTLGAAGTVDATTTVMLSGGTEFGISKSGSGVAHNNLQPYYTCYIWLRIA